MDRWAEAARDAAAIEKTYPGWRARPVRLRWGPGVEAVRDGHGKLRALIGPADEVRTVLSAERAA